MSIESIGESYEDTMLAPKQAFLSSSWFENRGVFDQMGRFISVCVERPRDSLVLMKMFGSYVIGNYPVGRCLHGHVAYHKYMQDNHPPILLCDEEEKKCPFALLRFMHYVKTGQYPK